MPDDLTFLYPLSLFSSTETCAHWKRKKRWKIDAGGIYVCYLFLPTEKTYKLWNGAWLRCGPDQPCWDSFKCFVHNNLLQVFCCRSTNFSSSSASQNFTLLHCVGLYLIVLRYTYTSGLASRLGNGIEILLYTSGVDVDAIAIRPWGNVTGTYRDRLYIVSPNCKLRWQKYMYSSIGE